MADRRRPSTRSRRDGAGGTRHQGRHPHCPGARRSGSAPPPRWTSRASRRSLGALDALIERGGPDTVLVSDATAPFLERGFELRRAPRRRAAGPARLRAGRPRAGGSRPRRTGGDVRGSSPRDRALVEPASSPRFAATVRSSGSAAKRESGSRGSSSSFARASRGRRSCRSKDSADPTAPRFRICRSSTCSGRCAGSAKRTTAAPWPRRPALPCSTPASICSTTRPACSMCSAWSPRRSTWRGSARR